MKAADKFTADKFRWLDQVGADAELTPLCFRVAYAIVTHLNRATGDAWPSQARLAESCHTTDRSIRDALSDLEDFGHLQRTGQGGRGLTTRVKPIIKDAETRNDTSTFTDINPEAGFQDTTPKPGSFRPKTRKISTLNPEDFDTKRGSQLPTIPMIDTIEETCRRKIPAEFENWFANYPKHVGEANALKAYRRIIKTGRATDAELLAGAIRYSAEQANTEPRFIKEAKNWLAGEHWRDTPSPPSTAIRSRADSALDGMHSYIKDTQ